MKTIDRLRKLVGSDIDVDINKLVSKIQSLDYYNAKSEILFTSIVQLQSLYKNTPASNSVDNILKSFQQQLSTLIVPSDRISKYELYLSMISRLPEVSQALTVYVDNVLSPDETLKRALIINVDDSNKESIIPKVKSLIDEFNLEDDVISIVQQTLLFGDAYVGIDLIDINKNLEVVSDNTTKLFEMTIAKNKEVYLTEVDAKEFLLESTNDFISPKKIQEHTNGILNEFETNPNSESGLNLVRISKYLPWTVIPINYKGLTLGYIVFPDAATPEQALVGNYTAHTKTLAYTATDTDTMISTLNQIVSNFLDTLKTQLPNLNKALDDNPSLKLELAELFYRRNLEKLAESPQKVVFYPPAKFEHFRIPSIMSNVYGDSLFAGVAMLGKYLLTMEYAMLIYRLVRAPEHRIFKINVGSSREVGNYINQVIRQTKQKETSILATNNIDTMYGDMSMFEDYYIPVDDEGKESMTIETVPGGELTAKIEDVEYMRKKLISGLGIPAAYLSGEDQIESKYTLSQENIKFTRSIIKLQKIISQHFTNFIRKLWLATGNDKTIANKIHITLSPPIALEFEKTNEILENITGLVEKLSVLLPKVDKQELATTILKKYLPMSEIQEIITKSLIKPSTNEEEEANFGNEELNFGNEEETKKSTPTKEPGEGGGLF